MKLLKKFFHKKPTNPYGVDEEKLNDMIKHDLPITIIQNMFPNLPKEVLVKYIISGTFN